MRRIQWIFGDQCYYWSSFLLESNTPILIWESSLFLQRRRYHKQKLIFLYSSLRLFAQWLRDQGKEVWYFDLNSPQASLSREKFFDYLHQQGVTDIDLFPPASQEIDMMHHMEDYFQVHMHSETSFLTPKHIYQKYFQKHSFQFLPFYKAQRKYFHILMDGSKPRGGKWTFDTENRKSYPRDLTFPEVEVFHDTHTQQVIDQVKNDISFINTCGKGEQCIYPVTRQEAWQSLEIFCQERLVYFGTYEDAIDIKNHTGYHSLLSMVINNGILHPQEVISFVVQYGEEHPEISLNQVEGFLRQVLGWREYIKNIYDARIQEWDQDNFFHFTKPIPQAFWTGETGLLPVDTTIHSVLGTGYCHHIERLMILGNIMLLCEFHPQEVTEWFHCLFVDAYDWVMKPNVLGMSQYADGGRMMTKPYISSSNYILKMSNYPQDGYWEKMWDALFWRFISRHQDILKSQARMHFMVAHWQKKTVAQQKEYLYTAEEFLSTL